MPAEQNSIGSKEPAPNGERFSPAIVASIGRGIKQPLQFVAMDSICVMAADTSHGIVPSYLNRNLRVVARIS